MKRFLIIGNVQSIKYKEVFPLFKDNKMWIGCSSFNVGMRFIVPDEYKTVRVSSICWYTNLDHMKRHSEISYCKERIEFRKYDNYDAIDVPNVKMIPDGYYGVMGVPITFVGKYNPNQFDIIDLLNRYTICGTGDNETVRKNHSHMCNIDGKPVFTRILIRRRRKVENQMTNKEIHNQICGLAKMYSEELEDSESRKVMSQDELEAYCRDSLGGKWQDVVKTAWIKILEEAVEGQKYTTVTRDEDKGEWVETANIAKGGQYLVQNVYGDGHQPDEEKDPSKWLLKKSQIENNYELNSPIEVGMCYKPKTIVRKGVQLNEPISFVASWGSQMNAKTGDWLVKAGEGDIYRIDKTVFFNTYEFGNGGTQG